MKLLDQLGRKHGTDKASGGHDYLVFYERFLSRFRKKPITLLEMGVGNSASLCMWRDYFPLAKVVGLDIQDDRLQYAGGRIFIEIGDQADGSVLDSLFTKHGPFDVIVDDAGHHGPAQIFAYEQLMHRMNEGGIYILEDIGDPNVSRYLTDLAQRLIHGENAIIESMAFYKETSVTRRR